MRRTFFLKSLSVIAVSAAAIMGLASLRSSGGVVLAQNGVTQGQLQVIDAAGKPRAVCPLKHTSARAEISGFLSRVVVTHEFENPFDEKTEPSYTFPLPHKPALANMT